MRIAYFAHLNEGRGSGVVSKISAQVGQWRREGHTVRLFIATTDVDTSWTSVLGDTVVCRYGGPLSRLRAMARLVRSVRGFRPAIVYLRWELFYPPMLFFPAGAPLVAEINTDDATEAALGSPVRARYNALTRGLLLRRAAAFVLVAAELGRVPSYRRFKARQVVITNGIDLAAYPSLPAPSEGPPRLVFIGTPEAPWNGVDKLVTLATMRPGWCFEIAGVEPVPGPALPNLAWHPLLERAEVLRLLGRADVGVGTLALHRKSLDDGSPLKVREYLAVGLPVLYAYADADADGLGAPYVLRIANTETNVVDELAAIDSFVGAARGVRVPRSSVAGIDVTTKERQRLALFADLARE